MENTFLVGLSQQVASHRSMEVIANNLANLSTPAFKQETVAFEEYLMNVPATEAEGGGTIPVAFVLDRGVVRDLTGGRLEQTNGVLDFALEGPGYFVVDTPEGERYTRNGHFQLDNQGRVVTDDGYVVQSDGGAIALQQQDSDIRSRPRRHDQYPQPGRCVGPASRQDAHRHLRRRAPVAEGGQEPF